MSNWLPACYLPVAHTSEHSQVSHLATLLAGIFGQKHGSPAAGFNLESLCSVPKCVGSDTVVFSVLYALLTKPRAHQVSHIFFLISL